MQPKKGFNETLEDFSKILVNLVEKKEPFSFTLNELSRIQSIKALLDKVQFLNMVYNENTRLKYDYYKKKFRELFIDFIKNEFSIRKETLSTDPISKRFLFKESIS